MSQSAEWWRAYRARRGAELRAYNADRRKQPKLRAQRYACEAKRRARLRVDTTPLPRLLPELQTGTTIAFWQDELALDLFQERALAVLEGRDPDEAVRAYRARERDWAYRTAPLVAA